MGCQECIHKGPYIATTSEPMREPRAQSPKPSSCKPLPSPPAREPSPPAVVKRRNTDLDRPVLPWTQDPLVADAGPKRNEYKPNKRRRHKRKQKVSAPREVSKPTKSAGRKSSRDPSDVSEKRG